jgi:preprotein translocase subunit SecE
MLEYLYLNFGKIFLGISVGILLFFIIKHFAKISLFISQVKTELTKVSWPTRSEVVTSTMVILVMTAFLAVYVGVIELGLSKILTLFLK